MDFIKMHGLGNDFVMFDAINGQEPENLPELARFTCDRRFGIGADGLIIMLPSQKADLRMRIFNSDGSEPEMCGNGIRCFAVLAYEKGLVKKPDLTVETLAGIIKPLIVFNEDGTIKGVRVDMGEPRLKPQDIPLKVTGEKAVNKILEVSGQNLNYTAVSMGNPHCIIFVDDVDNAPVTTLGPKIEVHPLFPKKVNVEFIEVQNTHEVKMRVWERGAGETLACGTGACATAVACVLNNKTERQITVHLAAGDLEIEWADNNHIFMTGPAKKVFEGKLITTELNGGN